MSRSLVVSPQFLVASLLIVFFWELIILSLCDNSKRRCCILRFCAPAGFSWPDLPPLLPRPTSPSLLSEELVVCLTVSLPVFVGSH